MSDHKYHSTYDEEVPASAHKAERKLDGRKNIGLDEDDTK